MRTSYSALQTFRDCPLRYKAQYIDKMPSAQSIEALLGVALHSAFEYMLDPLTPLPSYHEVEKRFLSIWQSAHVDNGAHERHTIEGIDMVRSFYRRNKEIKSRVYAVEMSVILPLGGHVAYGFIDRLDKEVGKESYEIIDYKTGARTFDESDVKRNLQLGIYALALKKSSPLFPPEKIITTLYATRADQMISVEPTEEDLVYVHEEVLKTIQEIEHAIEHTAFTPRKNKYCDQCPLRSRCVLWKT